MDAIVDVAKNPDEVPRRQYNGRWRTAGVRDGVDIVVLVESGGEINTAYPVRGPGVTRNPDQATDPAHPMVADLVAGKVSHFAGVLLDALADRLLAEDLAHYRSLHHAGEWEELADSLAAHLVKEDVALTLEEHENLRRLLTAFEVPAAGCGYLNDRDNVLAALRP